MKNKLTFLAMGLVLALTSCGDQHKAQSLVKVFLNENLEEKDCSYERFSRLTPTAMIDMNGVKAMRQHMSQMPYVKKNINYQDASAISDTLLYIRATYKLTDKAGKEQELTQTFYMDKALTRVVAFKEN